MTIKFTAQSTTVEYAEDGTFLTVQDTDGFTHRIDITDVTGVLLQQMRQAVSPRVGQTVLDQVLGFAVADHEMRRAGQ